MNPFASEQFKKKTSELESSGAITPTKNQAGWQINKLDEFGEIFVEYAKSTTRPVLDLAVAYGFTTKKLLEAGATVVANEISAEMLEELGKSIDVSSRNRITLKPGNALDLKLASDSLDGIWANRFFHYLKPDEVRTLLGRFFDWLVPGGKLCITIASEYFTQADPEEYAKRAASGMEWPGFFELPSEAKEQWGGVVPFFHCFSLEVLERELRRVGFVIEKSSYIKREHSGDRGAEGVGAIAVKPSK